MNEKILKKGFSIWNKLDFEMQNTLLKSSKIISYKKGDIIHRGENSCLGLIIIDKGLVKAFSSPDGNKKITLYRLYDNDMCLFTASCIMKDVSFDIFLECEEDTTLLLVPTEIFDEVINKSSIIANYINKIILSRFSDVMWILEQVTFHRLDKRIADYLINLGDDEIIITHEKIASDLGSAREVISRLLKHFEKDNLVKLERNKITIINRDKLLEISNN